MSVKNPVTASKSPSSQSWGKSPKTLSPGSAATTCSTICVVVQFSKLKYNDFNLINLPDGVRDPLGVHHRLWWRQLHSTKPSRPERVKLGLFPCSHHQWQGVITSEVYDLGLILFLFNMSLALRSASSLPSVSLAFSSLSLLRIITSAPWSANSMPVRRPDNRSASNSTIRRPEKGNVSDAILQ